mgnify:CR=1 FL=1
MFKFKPNIFNHEIGIDIGTVNTVIYVKSKGVMIDERRSSRYATSTARGRRRL